MAVRRASKTNPAALRAVVFASMAKFESVGSSCMYKISSTRSAGALPVPRPKEEEQARSPDSSPQTARELT